MTQELQLYEGAPPPLSPINVRQQINLIQEIMRDAMREGEHYGKIPGCGDKPTLLKPGAEKLNLTFRMAPKYQIVCRDLGGGHREYEVVASLSAIGSEKFLGEGVGSCSTMEGKYRYRTGPGESTGKMVPKEYWNNRDQELLGGKGFQAKKVDGRWEIVRQGEKVEHDNPADYYNTILKMAKKRALVDAVLTVTAASDIFTQDIEDMPEVIDAVVVEEKKEEKPKQTKKQAKQSISEFQNKVSRGIELAGQLGYSREDLESWLGPMAEWTEVQLNELRAWYKRETEKIAASD